MKKLMVYLVYRGNIYDKNRIICPLNDNLTTFRVKCTEDDKLYIKKILDRPQFEIYKIIQEKDYDGVPKIKELFYSPENDKYILYEECNRATQ